MCFLGGKKLDLETLRSTARTDQFNYQEETVVHHARTILDEILLAFMYVAMTVPCISRTFVM